MSNSTTQQPDSCCSSCQTSQNRAIINYFRHGHTIVSLALLLAGLLIDYVIKSPWFTGETRLAWYVIAYIPVAAPVITQAFRHLQKGEVFTEFFLMTIATLGAFYIGEYPEGVAVMLFYTIGESFQQSAVRKARNNIQSLLDIRPQQCHVKRGGAFKTIHPQTVTPGERIQVKPGERVPLDGSLISGRSLFDTSALTGESIPRAFQEGEKILAGMINLEKVIELDVISAYENSSVARILQLVQDAASRKAKTELFIRSFAKIYTPIVVLLAVMIVVLPAFFVSLYDFEDWLYRSLVFLVISCPCALVVSIPLGYFGGIGSASKNGILVKGSNYLDALTAVDTVVFDKTGTLTKGVFNVQHFVLSESLEKDVLPIIAAVVKQSSHPVSKAVDRYLQDRFQSLPLVDQQEEIPGHGIRARVHGTTVLVGNRKLLEMANVTPAGIEEESTGAAVYFAIDGKPAGFAVISDEVKEDAAETMAKLRAQGVRKLFMLSGDKQAIAETISQKLGLDYAFGELLPEDKTDKITEIKRLAQGTVAYAGDGINDAPALTLSDVGIAMGAMGSDSAIETADVVIQTDQLLKIPTIIQIARKTRTIVWQNIFLAMSVKALFLGLGALGVASLWEAVFADVGVALLAILNAIRIQHSRLD